MKDTHGACKDFALGLLFNFVEWAATGSFCEDVTYIFKGSLQVLGSEDMVGETLPQ